MIPWHRSKLLTRPCLASIAFCVLLFYSFHKITSRGWPLAPAIGSTPEQPELACRSVPGSEDVVVVMKTGSTELIDKLPIHLSTTLKCYPNHLIFSDYGEYFEGKQIIDALESVSPRIKAEHADFDLWRRLQADGRSSLLDAELSGPYNRPHGGLGKDDNPGWKLDKWKFLPMMNRTLVEYPRQKWYLFVETDTYIFWQTALQHLAALDWTKPYYLGSEMQIGEVLFAHGGSGFAVSRPAMEAVAELYASNQTEWEDFIDGHWAGDCVLGKAFLNSGTSLLWANPIWQGMPVGKLNYEKQDHLCRPTVSYHHSSRFAIHDMWTFEQSWIADPHVNDSDFLRHVDIFDRYILPRTAEPRSDWDNHSDDDQGPVQSLEACHAICQAMDTCIQYALHSESRCTTSSRPTLGEASKGTNSGWIRDRMEGFLAQAGPCQDDGWIT